MSFLSVIPLVLLNSTHLIWSVKARCHNNLKCNYVFHKFEKKMAILK